MPLKRRKRSLNAKFSLARFIEAPLDVQHHILAILATDDTKLRSLLLVKAFNPLFDDRNFLYQLMRARHRGTQLPASKTAAKAVIRGLIAGSFVATERIEERLRIHDGATNSLKQVFHLTGIPAGSYVVNIKPKLPGTHVGMSAAVRQEGQPERALLPPPDLQARPAMEGFWDRWDGPNRKQAVGSILLHEAFSSLQIATDGTQECEVARVELQGPVKPGLPLQVDPQWASAPSPFSLLWEELVVGGDDFSQLCVSRMWTPEHGTYEIGYSGPHVAFTYAAGTEVVTSHGFLGMNDAETTALANHRSFEWVATNIDNLAATAKRMVPLSTDVRGAKMGAARVDFCGWEGDKPDMRMLTTGPVMCDLPGKYVEGSRSPTFCFRGNATDGNLVRLERTSEFKLLCYRIAA